MLEGKRIAITGGAGYLGLRLARALAPLNDVLLIDRSESVPADLSGKVRFAKSDVSERGRLTELLSDIDIVFHRAGVYGSLESMKRPHDYYRIGVEGTLNVLEASRLNKVKRFIFDSTETVYGTHVRSPITEDQQPRPRSIYGATKLVAEGLVRFYDKRYGLPTLIFRYSRTRDAAKRDAIMILSEKVLKGEEIALYNGGEPVIDFGDVDDLVQANILGACSDLRNEAINISSGEGISFRGMVETIQELAGKRDNRIVSQPLPDFPPISEFLFGPEVNYMSVDKARRLLGWAPKTTTRESIRQTLDYIRAREGHR